MNLLSRLTIKNLKLNKHRTIVTVVGIILSISLLTAIFSLFFSARASLLAYQIKEQGNYHYVFKDVSADEYEAMKQHHGLESIDAITNIGYARLTESANAYKPYAFLQSISGSTGQIVPTKLIEGRLPANDTELVIPSHLRYNGKIYWNVGDVVTLSVGKRVSDDNILSQSNPYHPEEPEDIINTTEKTYTIVGIMERPPFRLENYEAPGYTFYTFSDENTTDNRYDVFTRYTRSSLKISNTVTAQLLGTNENDIHNSVYNWESNDYLISLETGMLDNSTLQALASAVAIVVLIIIITSVFCIQNSFEISITEKIRQYGMLSSIGATRRQIRTNVYFEAAVLGLLAIPAGCIAGVLAAYVLIIISNHFLKNMLNFTLIFSISPYAIIFAIVMGIITILLSARKSARKASRISPIQAIRSQNEIRLNSKKLRSPGYVKHIFGIGGEIAYKSLKRSRRKYRTTIVSIVICVSVFISLSSFVTIAFDTIKAEYGNLDYTLSVGYYANDTTKDVRETVRKLPGIKSMAVMSRDRLMFKPKASDFTDEFKLYIGYSDDMYATEYEPLSICFLDDDTFRDYTATLNLNYESVKGSAILVNTIFTETYDENNRSSTTSMTDVYSYKTSDTVSGFLESSDNASDDDRNNTVDNTDKRIEFSIKIGAITQKPPMGFREPLHFPILIVNEHIKEDYAGLSIPREWMYIDSSDTTSLQAQIENILGDNLIMSDNIEESANSMRSLYTLLSIFLYGFIIVIALIGVTNIFNTITTNMNLRRRELASLTSIGMTKKEFHRMIWLECFFYGTKSLLIGIPSGCLLSYIIYSVLSSGQMVVRFQPPIKAICICVVSVFVLLLVIMRYSISKLQRQNTIETIRNENI